MTFVHYTVSVLGGSGRYFHSNVTNNTVNNDGKKLKMHTRGAYMCLLIVFSKKKRTMSFSDEENCSFLWKIYIFMRWFETL